MVIKRQLNDKKDNLKIRGRSSGVRIPSPLDLDPLQDNPGALAQAERFASRWGPLMHWTGEGEKYPQLCDAPGEGGIPEKQLCYLFHTSSITPVQVILRLGCYICLLIVWIDVHL